jgi:hypothetical protein
VSKPKNAPVIEGLDNLLEVRSKVDPDTLLKWLIDQNKELKHRLERIQLEHAVICQTLANAQARLRILESRQAELRDRIAHNGPLADS